MFVVDDDASVREALSSLIRSIGLRVETFSSAQEFLSYPRPNAAACLVLDVRLPDGDGLELARRLKSDPATSGCAILACSAGALIPAPSATSTCNAMAICW